MRRAGFSKGALFLLGVIIALKAARFAKQNAVIQVVEDRVEEVTQVGSKGESALKNVLLLLVDDLTGGVRTKGLAELVRGVEFNNAFAQYPLCNPSRASLLSGRRPDELSIYDLDSRINQNIVLGVPTLFQFFKNQGYITLSGGKVFHGESSKGFDIVFASSTVRPWEGNPCSKSGPNTIAAVTNQKVFRKAMCRMKDGFETVDEKTTRAAVKQIEEHERWHNASTPFFMAIGLVGTHLPWVISERFWKQARKQGRLAQASSVIPASKFPFGVEPSVLNGQVIHMEFVKPAEMEQVRLAYEASILQLEYHVGEILRALERAQLAPNTAVVLTADHGFSVGEDLHFGKRNLNELSLRVPLLLRCPWCQTPSRQATKQVDSPVESIDLYRTLADLADIGVHVPNSIGGKSLKPYIAEDIASTAQEESVAVSQVVRCGVKEVCPTDLRPIGQRVKYMGYSARSLNWRYTVWVSLRPVEGTSFTQVEPLLEGGSSIVKLEELYSIDSQGNVTLYSKQDKLSEKVKQNLFQRICSQAKAQNLCQHR